MNTIRSISGVVVLSVLGAAELFAQSPQQLQAVEAALPSAPTAPPRVPRKILLFSLCQGAVHEIVPLAEKTFVKMGEKSGAFTAVPSNRMEVFDPAVLREYDAILFNNTTQLKFENPAHRAALVEFVRGGKGLIGIHAATDNFYDFPEAAELIGGIFDGHPWMADGTWAVKLDDRDHPLNRAFGGGNFSISDEIYEFRGPYSRDTHRVLLSLDLSRPENQGPRSKRTDNDHAISWIKRGGEGRVFYSALGHNPSVYANPAVLRHFLDGIQYALGDLKADDTPSARAQGVKPGDPEPLCPPALAAYKTGDPQTPFRAMEARIRSADAGQRRGMEKDLLAFLATANATPDAKRELCRVLLGCASEASVPVVSKLLPDRETSHMARWVLQGIPAASVDVALLEALKTAPADLQAGLLSSLAARRTAAAVGPAAERLTSSAPNLAEAAVAALGRIGTIEADRALRTAQADARLAARVFDARLACAESLQASGRTADVTSIYREVFTAAPLPSARMAALNGLLRVDPESGLRATLAALAAEDPLLRMAAAGAVVHVPAGPEATRRLVEPMRRAAPELQALLLVSLGRRGDRTALPEVLRHAQSNAPAVRAAALEAVTRLGDASNLPALYRGLLDAATADATAEAMRTMPGAWVGPALTAELEAGRHAGLRVKLAGILGLRKEVSALPALMKLWPDAEPDLQAAALQAIGVMGTEKELPALAAGIAGAKDAAVRRGLARTAQEIALRRPEPAAGILTEGMKQAAGESRGELIRILGRVGGAGALATIRAELASEQPEVRRSAVHALSTWATPEPLADLLAMAKSDADAATQRLALRRFIAMTTAAKNLSNEDRAAHLKSAFPLATRREEKRGILAALISIPSPSAIELARSALAQPDVAADARRVLMQIDGSWITELLKNLRLTASANSGAAKNALDGDMNTRWDTGRGMQAGDWFQIDLGETKRIAGLVVDAGSSKVDYARGLDVLASPDGQAWTKLIAIPENKEPVLPVSFPEAASTRFIRLVQTGTAGGGLHWSIHEIRLDIVE